MLCTSQAHGVCLQLPSAELRAIDDLAEGYPERGLAEANRRLAQAAVRHEPFIEAQLHAIIAAVRAPQGSIERACALAARADLRAESLQLDNAAADGIAAYTTAEHEEFEVARIQAAVSLAEIYRRSGPRDEAERMLPIYISHERSRDHPAQVASALYMRGQILTEARNYGETRAVLETSRRMAEEAGDHFSAIFADVALCPALIGAGDLDAAERVCSEHNAEFALARRDDVTTLMKAYRARIDLERGRPAAALAKLNDVLGRHAADVVANLEPQVYLDRARARAALGQTGGAYIDVRHSLELQRSLDRDQRGRSAAALKGAADADRLAASNRLLEERLTLQRAELTNRTLKQRLAVAIAVAATIVGALFGCLFWMARRHERYIRRQEAVLRTVSSYAPDALLLLDQQRRVRFCNRNLFGGVGTPEPGQTLDGIVPGEALPAVQAALEELFDQRRSTTCAAHVTDALGSLRQFELRGVPVIEDGLLIGATLRGKEILLQEVHHRVKNNLQIISSLINMQLRRLKDSSSRETLEQCQHRVQAIAFIHEKLYQSKNLAHDIFQAACAPATTVPLDLTIAEIALPINQAIPCGLILNELITKALKHAFPDGRQGSIRISVDWLDASSLKLTVADNGVGLPAEFDTGRCRSMGLQLLDTLARQLNAQLEVDVHGGASFQLTFPVER